MIRLLVSVRTVDEALEAAAGGTDFVDLKEPNRGALGALAPEQIAVIVGAVRARYPGVPLSATTGDFDDPDDPRVMAAVERVASCGVDYVKVGVPPGPRAFDLLHRLSRSPRSIVPVLLCDGGVDLALWRVACAAPFPAVVADTRDKAAGSLVDCVGALHLATMIRVARAGGKLVGLAGALGIGHVPQLQTLAPDFAGFRGAVCDEGRTGKLVPEKLRALARALRAETSAPCHLADLAQ